MFATRAFLAVSRTLNIGPLCQEVKTSDVLQPPVVCWAGAQRQRRDRGGGGGGGDDDDDDDEGDGGGDGDVGWGREREVIVAWLLCGLVKSLR